MVPCRYRSRNILIHFQRGFNANQAFIRIYQHLVLYIDMLN
uniref:Uncharacterized protein n=1 Tax=Anguilla anguilla TaxID=7936 RepID=A0A0E9RKM3_ANGAN